MYLYESDLEGMFVEMLQDIIRNPIVISFEPQYHQLPQSRSDEKNTLTLVASKNDRCPLCDRGSVEYIMRSLFEAIYTNLALGKATNNYNLQIT